MGSGGWLTHLIRFAQICSGLVDGSLICSDGNEMRHEYLQGSAGADGTRHCPSNPNLISATLVNSLTSDGLLSMHVCRFLNPGGNDSSTRNHLLGSAKEGNQADLPYDEQEGIIAGLLKPDMVPMELGCSGQVVVGRFSI